MNKLQQRRLWLILIFAIGLSLAAGLILYALKQNINVFLTPSQIHDAKLHPEDRFRLGGMVKYGSFKRDEKGLGVKFIVSDAKAEMSVYYQGVLPDLFREGTGVIAEGSLNHRGIFQAKEILAKHDENYMPKKVYRSLREKA